MESVIPAIQRYENTDTITDGKPRMSPIVVRGLADYSEPNHNLKHHITVLPAEENGIQLEIPMSAYERWAVRHYHVAAVIYCVAVIFYAAAKILGFFLSGAWRLISGWFCLFSRHPIAAVVLLALLPRFGLLASRTLKHTEAYKFFAHTVGMKVNSTAVPVKKPAVKKRILK